MRARAARGGPDEPGDDSLEMIVRPVAVTLAYALSIKQRTHVTIGWRGAVAVSDLSRTRILFTAAVVFAVPYILFYRLVMFHFYVRGGFLLDTGLLGSLMWHNTLALALPPSLGGFSFYAIHVAPILSLVSAVSQVLPLSMPQLFACFLGLCHGMLALTMFWLLVEGHGMRQGWSLGLAVLASGGFAFNGLALAIARYPHFEMFGAVCLTLFFVALTLERRAIAATSFLFALATREDVGLHAFGFLMVWFAVNWWQGVREHQNQRLLGYAAAALTYSTIAILLQHWKFPDSSSFVRIYLGDPPFSHVGWTLLFMHGFGWIKIHSAIFLPLGAALIWAQKTRDPFIVAGYVACIPWAVLHLFAVSDYAGWMVGYYAYPFLIAMAWPLLVGAGPADRDPVPSARPGVRLAIIVSLSLLPLGPDFDPGKIPLPGAFLHAPSADQQRLTDRAIAAVAAARPMLGRLLVDKSVDGLAPLAFSHSEIAGWEKEPPNTVVFLEDGFDSAKLRSTPNLPAYYAVPGTMVRIMTDRPEAVLRDVAGSN